LMDLHRVEKYSHIPKSKRMKDLAGLYFSAMHIGLSQRDYLRFLRGYFQQSLSEVFKSRQLLLVKIHKRAVQLDQKFLQKRAKGIAL